MDVLVENCGRVNYGTPPLLQRKGLGQLLINDQPPADGRCQRKGTGKKKEDNGE